MADRFYRLVTFVVNICPMPLRELFEKYAEADVSTGLQFTTIDAYMKYRRKDVILIKNLTKDQLNLIYATSPADTKNWDVTLLILLLTKMFGSQVKPLTSCFKNIKKHRNTLQHMSSTEVIQETEFQNMWKELSDSTKVLAQNAQWVNYKNKIDYALVGNMPDLGDTLRKWYSDKINELQGLIEVLQEDISEISAGTKESNQILKRSSWISHIRSSGTVTRRLKTVSAEGQHMQDYFESTMTHSLPDDFQAPPELTVIADELRKKHFVIVSGYKDSIHLQTALSTIKYIKFTTERCKHLVHPVEWRYVVQKDTDLVLFTNPFGTEFYDLEKAKAMSDIRDSIRHATLPDNGGNSLCVVIVTDIAMLKEFQSHFDHEMYANPVMVFTTTTDTSLIDLTKETSHCRHHHSGDSQYSNLLAQSICHVNRRKLVGVSPYYLDKAKDIFKCHKMLVITGQQGCGKTSLAFALLASYDNGHYLILKEPEDVRLIKIGETCVVVIEDFTGKYGVETTWIQKWFRKFDMLIDVVREGKLNVIITCDEINLKLCQSKIAKHPILDHVIRLPVQGVIDKDVQLLHSERNLREAYSFDKLDEIEKNFQENTGRCFITYDICSPSDGTFFVSKERSVLRLNSRFEIEEEFPVKYCKRILSMDSGDILMLGRKELTIQRIAGEQFVKKHGTDVRSESESVLVSVSVSCLNERVFALNNHGHLHEYDSNLKLVEKFQISFTWNPLNDIVSTVSIIVVSNKCMFLLTDTSCCIYHYEAGTMRYFIQEKFSPLAMCRCNNSSVFVLGVQNENRSRIYQLDTKMCVLSQIDLHSDTHKTISSREMQMVFDKHNCRLVMMKKGKISQTVYLKRR